MDVHKLMEKYTKSTTSKLYTTLYNDILHYFSNGDKQVITENYTENYGLRDLLTSSLLSGLKGSGTNSALNSGINSVLSKLATAITPEQALNAVSNIASGNTNALTGQLQSIAENALKTAWYQKTSKNKQKVIPYNEYYINDINYLTSLALNNALATSDMNKKHKLTTTTKDTYTKNTLSNLINRVNQEMYVTLLPKHNKEYYDLLGDVSDDDSDDESDDDSDFNKQVLLQIPVLIDNKLKTIKKYGIEIEPAFFLVDYTPIMDKCPYCIAKLSDNKALLVDFTAYFCYYGKLCDTVCENYNSFNRIIDPMVQQATLYSRTRPKAIYNERGNDTRLYNYDRIRDINGRANLEYKNMLLKNDKEYKLYN